MRDGRTCGTCGADISFRHHLARYCSLKCTAAAAIQRGTKKPSRKASPTQQGDGGNEGE